MNSKILWYQLLSVEQGRIKSCGFFANEKLAWGTLITLAENYGVQLLGQKAFVYGQIEKPIVNFDNPLHNIVLKPCKNNKILVCDYVPGSVYGYYEKVLITFEIVPVYETDNEYIAFNEDGTVTHFSNDVKLKDAEIIQKPIPRVTCHRAQPTGILYLDELKEALKSRLIE